MEFYPSPYSGTIERNLAEPKRETAQKRWPYGRRALARWLVSLALLGGLLAARTWWPEGAEQIRGVLIADNTGPIVTAARGFAENIRDGIGVERAVEVFWGELEAYAG